MIGIDCLGVLPLLSDGKPCWLDGDRIEMLVLAFTGCVSALRASGIRFQLDSFQLIKVAQSRVRWHGRNCRATRRWGAKSLRSESWLHTFVSVQIYDTMKWIPDKWRNQLCPIHCLCPSTPLAAPCFKWIWCLQNRKWARPQPRYYCGDAVSFSHSSWIHVCHVCIKERAIIASWFQTWCCKIYISLLLCYCCSGVILVFWPALKTQSLMVWRLQWWTSSMKPVDIEYAHKWQHTAPRMYESEC